MPKSKPEMPAEYDFEGKKGVRGKYAKAYSQGHSVRITKGKKVLSDQYFASIEPEMHVFFPDSKAVNKALRAIVSSLPKELRESAKKI
jgi:hypothetical protein